LESTKFNSTNINRKSSLDRKKCQIIISESMQHNLPRMTKNQTYSVCMVQLVQGTMSEASFTSTP